MSVGGTRASEWYVGVTGDAALNYIRNVPGCSFACAFTARTLQNGDGIFQATRGAGSERVTLRVNNGKVLVYMRPVDGGAAYSAETSNAISTTTTNTLVVSWDFVALFYRARLNGVETAVASAGTGASCSDTALSVLQLFKYATSLDGRGEEPMLWNRALSDAEMLAVEAALSGTGPWSAVPAVGMRIPLRGQSGHAVPALPVLSGTIGDVSTGIATPSGSPVYGADLTPEPPQSGVVGVRFVGSAAQYADLTGAVLAGTNAEAGLFFAGWFTASSFAAVQSLFCASTNTATAPRFGVGVDASAQVVVSGRRLDADAATTDLASTEVLAANARQFVAGLACFATGKLRVLVGSTWKEVTGVSGWTDVCSATNSARMNTGRCVSTTQPEFGLSEQPIFGSWKIADGDPPDSWFADLRAANGRYIPAPWGAGVEIYDLSTIPDFRAGDAVPQLPIRKTMLAGVTVAGVATPANGPTFQESLLSEPMWRPRISGGASRIRTQSYWNIVGAGGLTRNATALTLEWWGDSCAANDGAGLVTITVGTTLADTRLDMRLIFMGAVRGYSRRLDVDSVTISTAGQAPTGPCHCSLVANCATRTLVLYLGGTASAAGTLSTGTAFDDTDALATYVARNTAGFVGCVRHSLATLHRRAMSPAEIAHRYRLLRDGRMPEVGDAAMALDLSRERPGSSGIIRDLVRPHACYASPVNSPIIVPGLSLATPRRRLPPGLLIA